MAAKVRIQGGLFAKYPGLDVTYGATGSGPQQVDENILPLNNGPT